MSIEYFNLFQTYNAHSRPFKMKISCNELLQWSLEDGMSGNKDKKKLKSLSLLFFCKVFNIISFKHQRSKANMLKNILYCYQTNR